MPIYAAANELKLNGAQGRNRTSDTRIFSPFEALNASNDLADSPRKIGISGISGYTDSHSDSRSNCPKIVPIGACSDRTIKTENVEVVD